MFIEVLVDLVHHVQMTEVTHIQQIIVAVAAYWSTRLGSVGFV